MKKLKFLYLALVAFLAAGSFTACNADGEYHVGDIYPSALVTVKPYANLSGCYLQLDQTTTLYPVNITGLPYGTKPVRALVEYLAVDDDPKDCTQAVRVVQMQEVLTKQMVQWGILTQEELGDDPIEIVKDWVTLVEDGFLTLRFRTTSSGNGTKHFLNLVKGVNPEDPYELHLRHNANGDTKGNLADGIVAFDLSSLPASLNPEQTIKVVWTSFSGEKSTEFALCGDDSIVSTSSQTITAPSEVKAE